MSRKSRSSLEQIWLEMLPRNLVLQVSIGLILMYLAVRFSSLTWSLLGFLQVWCSMMALETHLRALLFYRLLLL